jgi:hypothetical protein
MIEAIGVELPVFAIFDLEGSHRVSFEIGREGFPSFANGTGLLSHMPLQKAQPFVGKINERRSKVRVCNMIAVILGAMLGAACCFTHITDVRGALALLVLIPGSISGLTFGGRIDTAKKAKTRPELAGSSALVFGEPLGTFLYQGGLRGLKRQPRSS